jgi:glycine cleavage system aminomethyltransferase T
VSQPTPLYRTPLHHWHAARATRFTDSREGRLPLLYSTVEREVAAARSGVALADLSAFAKISLLGSGVPALAEALASASPITQVVRVDASTTYAGFLLAGPRLEDMLPCLTALDLTASLTPGVCAETALAGVHTLLVRAPELSVPCLRIYVGWDLAEFVWERLLDAGRHHGLTLLGLEALNALLTQA